MTQAQSSNRKKDLIALGCIAMSILGVILGVLYPKPIANSFSIGTILGMTAFLLSLGSVKDKGRNLIAMLAFWLSFIAMTMAIVFSSGV